MKAREVAVIGIMLALSLMLDIMPVEMPTVWGMKIDLVAVPIIMAYFITGFRGGAIAIVLLFLGLSITSQAGWLGAMMKAVATFSVLLGLEVAKRVAGFKLEGVGRRELVMFSLVAYFIGLAFRVPLMVALNYYVALPIWFGLPREAVIETVENWTHVPFWVAIALPNAIQSVIDVFLGVALTIPVLRRVPHILD